MLIISYLHKDWSTYQVHFPYILHVLHVDLRSFSRKNSYVINFDFIYSFWSTLFGQHLIVPLLIYLHISYAVNELNHTAHSDDFVCKINDFYRHYTHFARFSCRMCLFFNIYRRTGISSCHYLLQLKEKRMVSCGVSLGLSLDVLIYIIRSSKPESED